LDNYAKKSLGGLQLRPKHRPPPCQSLTSRDPERFSAHCGWKAKNTADTMLLMRDNNMLEGRPMRLARHRDD
jgi:hypothetical protein